MLKPPLQITQNSIINSEYHINKYHIKKHQVHQTMTKMAKMMQMDKTLAKFSSRNLSPRQLFFLSKAQITNSAFVFGNMYSLHFAHYLRLDSSCKKGPLSLQEEQELLIETLENVNSEPQSPNSSVNSSPNSSPTHRASSPNKNPNSSIKQYS